MIRIDLGCFFGMKFQRSFPKDRGVILWGRRRDVDVIFGYRLKSKAMSSSL
jgi:hypothetical protein